MSGEKTERPAIHTSDKKIAQVGIVVHDAPRTAKNYSRIFGVGPWRFLDIAPSGVVLHDEPRPDGEACIRIALANLGKLQLELLQPLYGPSTHMEFLKEHGEGIHHVSFGRIDDHDDTLSAFRERGFGIEMQGVIGGALTFTYMSTQKELGTIFELVKPIPPGVASSARYWGTLPLDGTGAAPLQGKEVVQVGIVVEDVERTARSYWEILGIGPWSIVDFQPPHVSEVALYGIPASADDLHIRAALADFGDLQIELLQPVSGASTHMDFLKSRGPGVHHLSFGAVDDHDEFVSAMGSQGVGIEATGRLGGGARNFTYMASQKALGTIFEAVKIHPGVESTLVPSGTIPPTE